MTICLAVDIGGTKLAAALIDSRLTLLKRREVPTPASQTPAALAAALAALVAHLQLEQPLIVGHSLGALIGSAYAADYPDGLCGLVLADPAQGYASAPLE